MKRRQFLAGLAVLALMANLTGCGKGAVSSVPASPAETAPQEAAGHYPVTITNYDYAGNEVSFTYEQAPQRVEAV